MSFERNNWTLFENAKMELRVVMDSYYDGLWAITTPWWMHLNELSG